MPKNIFQQLLEQYKWNPIKGCPGRYVLSEGVTTLTPHQIVGFPLSVQQEKFPKATDPVQYGSFEGGGIISYIKDGGFLHTLCDESAMQRKLNMLRGKS